MSELGHNIIFIVGAIADEPCELASTLPANLGRAQLFPTAAGFLEHLQRDPSGDAACCLLLDLVAPDCSTIDLMAALQAKDLLPPTIIIASRADVRSAVRAMQSGAMDLFEWPVGVTHLAPCVECALAESRRRRDAKQRRAEVEARWNRLTAGEKTVARMICDGKASRQIGDALGLGRRTIENRRANIMAKMEVGSLAHLVRTLCGFGPDFPPLEQRE